MSFDTSAPGNNFTEILRKLAAVNLPRYNSRRNSYSLRSFLVERIDRMNLRWKSRTTLRLIKNFALNRRRRGNVKRRRFFSRFVDNEAKRCVASPMIDGRLVDARTPFDSTGIENRDK